MSEPSAAFPPDLSIPLLHCVAKSRVSTALKNKLAFSISSARIAHAKTQSDQWNAVNDNERCILAAYRFNKICSANAGSDLFTLDDAFPVLSDHVTKNGYKLVRGVSRRSASSRHCCLSFLAVLIVWRRADCA